MILVLTQVLLNDFCSLIGSSTFFCGKKEMQCLFHQSVVNRSFQISASHKHNITSHVFQVQHTVNAVL